MAELRVGLVFGGRSVEHEVSVDSARSVSRAMRQTSLVVVPLAVTSSGEWLAPAPSAAFLAGNARRVDESTVDDPHQGGRLAFQPGCGLVHLPPGGPSVPLTLDVVFPLIHGWGGEDGRLQGVLDWMRIPYVGSGVLGSALGMDKAMSKRLLHAAGLPVVEGLLFGPSDLQMDRGAAEQRVLEQLGLPLFVKPSNGGSSVGISRVDNPARLRAALELAFEHDERVIVERAVDAREIECAVLGNREPRASVLGEIVTDDGFYDYDAKYVNDSARLEIPASLPAKLVDPLRELALQAFKTLSLSGFARVDFLLQKPDGPAFINEVNTLPGFTAISMFPKLWEASGLSCGDLIEQLVTLAGERRL